jgi:hypothetical protein
MQDAAAPDYCLEPMAGFRRIPCQLCREHSSSLLGTIRSTLLGGSDADAQRKFWNPATVLLAIPRVAWAQRGRAYVGRACVGRPCGALGACPAEHEPVGHAVHDILQLGQRRPEPERCVVSSHIVSRWVADAQPACFQTALTWRGMSADYSGGLYFTHYA